MLFFTIGDTVSYRLLTGEEIDLEDLNPYEFVEWSRCVQYLGDGRFDTLMLKDFSQAFTESTGEDFKIHRAQMWNLWRRSSSLINEIHPSNNGRLLPILIEDLEARAYALLKGKIPNPYAWSDPKFFLRQEHIASGPQTRYGELLKEFNELQALLLRDPSTYTIGEIPIAQKLGYVLRKSSIVTNRKRRNRSVTFREQSLALTLSAMGRSDFSGIDKGTSGTLVFKRFCATLGPDPDGFDVPSQGSMFHLAHIEGNFPIYYEIKPPTDLNYESRVSWYMEQFPVFFLLFGLFFEKAGIFFAVTAKVHLSKEDQRHFKVLILENPVKERRVVETEKSLCELGAYKKVEAIEAGIVSDITMGRIRRSKIFELARLLFINPCYALRFESFMNKWFEAAYDQKIDENKPWHRIPYTPHDDVWVVQNKS